MIRLFDSPGGDRVGLTVGSLGPPPSSIYYVFFPLSLSSHKETFPQARQSAKLFPRQKYKQVWQQGLCSDNDQFLRWQEIDPV